MENSEATGRLSDDFVLIDDRDLQGLKQGISPIASRN
jgi:hypothetical protein